MVARMVGIASVGVRPRWDVALMAAGTSMGIFLEYWGTSRQCWTYYTGEVPPPVAVLAHGFASIAFSRALQVLGRWVSFETTVGMINDQSAAGTTR